MKIFYRVVLFIFVLITLVFVNLYINGPVSDLVFYELRLPRTLTALMAGALLGLSGAMLQTLFKNILAGPDILGIQSGASLAMAIWPLVVNIHILPPFLLNVGPWFFSGLGATLATLFFLILSLKLRHSVTLLLVGVIFSSFCTSAIGLLIPLLDSMGVRSYLIWGLGSFERVSLDHLLPMFVAFVAVFFLSLTLFRPLNALLAGDHFSKSLWGHRQFKLRLFFIILISSLCASIVTVNCGPIALIGLIAPHFSRWFVKRGHHLIFLPVSAFFGACIALFLQLLITSLQWPFLTINGIAGVLGGPIILTILIKRENKL